MSTVEFNQSLLGLEPNLMSFAFSFTRNTEDAQDLTQETMLRAIRYQSNYEQHTNFKAWVFTIMRNLFINQYRRNVKARGIFDYNKDSVAVENIGSREDTAIEKIGEGDIIREINKLKPAYKIPFDMHVQGFKYEEIADDLKLPVGTVKSRIFLARKKLMIALAGIA